MNIQRGFLRLSWAISIISAIGFLIAAFNRGAEFPGAIVLSLLAFAIVWIIYFVVKFVVSGFVDVETKQDNVEVFSENDQDDSPIDFYGRTVTEIRNLNSIGLLFLSLIFQVIVAVLILSFVRDIESLGLSYGGIAFGFGAIFSSAIFFHRNKILVNSGYAKRMLVRSFGIAAISSFQFLWIISVYHQVSQYWFGHSARRKLLYVLGISATVIGLSVAISVLAIISH